MKNAILAVALLWCVQMAGQTTEERRETHRKHVQEWMDKVEPAVPEIQQQKIWEQFENVWNEHPDWRRKRIYQTAVSRVVGDTARLHQFFQAEIDKAAQECYAQIMNEYTTRYNLTEQQQRSISKQAQALASILQIRRCQYAEWDGAATEAGKLEKAKYRRRIILILTRQGVKTDLLKYCACLQYRKELGITNEQARDLTIQAWTLKDMNKDNSLDVKKEELKLASEFLTEQQFEAYLAYRVMPKARKELEKTWKEMSDKDILAGMDTANVRKTVLAYYVEREKIHERYSFVTGKEDEKENKLAQLKERRPAALKKMQAYNKQEKKRKQKENKNLVW